MRFIYRARQYWHALIDSPAPEDLEQARRILPTPLMDLFMQLQGSEQVHSLRIHERLQEQNEVNKDLLVAALLHDVGKIRYPLHLWERVLIVVSNSLFPEIVKTWGQGEPRGWRRSFVVAEQHPAWGAEMAAKAGASLMAVALIRRHQEKPANQIVKGDHANDMLSGQPAEESTLLEDRLLSRLQNLDNES